MTVLLFIANALNKENLIYRVPIQSATESSLKTGGQFQTKFKKLVINKFFNELSARLYDTQILNIKVMCNLSFVQTFRFL